MTQLEFDLGEPSAAALDETLRQALEERYGDGPFDHQYAQVDLRNIETLAELATAIHKHLQRCSGLMDQNPQVETFRADAPARPDVLRAGEVWVAWESGPFDWACRWDPLGMQLPSWVLAQPHWGFDLVLCDERVRP